MNCQDNDILRVSEDTVIRWEAVNGGSLFLYSPSLKKMIKGNIDTYTIIKEINGKRNIANIIEDIVEGKFALQSNQKKKKITSRIRSILIDLYSRGFVTKR